MNRYLYRITYEYPDGVAPIAGVTHAYEPICVRAADEAAARTEVEGATDRYRLASGATRTVTLVATTADV